MDKQVLLLDFGSTYTKGTLVNMATEQVTKQGTVLTHSQTSLLESFYELKSQFTGSTPSSHLKIDEVIVCSSAFGGFKMVAIGLTESLTMAAAKRVALGAGTRLLKAYTYHLAAADISEINQLEPDVILLTGGTDGGNQQFLIDSARQLTNLEADIPIIVAGNQGAIPLVEKLLKNQTYYLSDNVMPKINLLQVETTRQLLRHLFFEKIIEAKGLSEIAKLSPFPILPTPAAILSAAELLAEGYEQEPGWGNLVIIDVGGATTDVHSAAEGIAPKTETLYEGLPEPYLKRTVEGDLGMRSSAISLYETAGMTYFNHFSEQKLTPAAVLLACQQREQQPAFIPTSPAELEMEQLIAKIAIDISVERHVGKLRRVRLPTHDVYYQQGKDLRQLNTLIGTGGVITHSPDPKKLLAAAFQREPLCLKPRFPSCYLDNNYLLSALGLLAEHYPAVALRMIKATLTAL